MLQTISEINDIINGFVWGAPAMICIIGVGILLSVRTGFIQFRKFPYAMKAILGKLLSKENASPNRPQCCSSCWTLPKTIPSCC